MKRAILAIVVAFSVIMSIFALNTGAEGISWYVKRAGNKRPQIPSEQQIIENYDGYYIDKKLTDDSFEKKIYITFDAGYENGNVERILDVLKEKHVPAAFFVLDHLVLKNTELVKRMTDEGHLVCNHTKNHKDLTKCSKEEIIKNVTDLEKIYEQKTGEKMAKYFRFPEGKYDESSLKCISELGYKTIFWSFGYADWDNANQPDLSKAYKKIIENTHNGEVILLHPTSSTNAELLPRLIDKWRDMGYSFGTLDELVK